MQSVSGDQNSWAQICCEASATDSAFHFWPKTELIGLLPKSFGKKKKEKKLAKEKKKRKAKTKIVKKMRKGEEEGKKMMKWTENRNTSEAKTIKTNKLEI